jgi:hypothetical protein
VQAARYGLEIANQFRLLVAPANDTAAAQVEQRCNSDAASKLNERPPLETFIGDQKDAAVFVNALRYEFALALVTNDANPGKIRTNFLNGFQHVRVGVFRERCHGGVRCGDLGRCLPKAKLPMIQNAVR